MSFLFVNAKIITGGTELKNMCVSTEGGAITYCGAERPKGEFDVIYDVEGNYLAPGLIDLHVHGANGYDFMDATKDAFLNIAEYHVRHGITSMLATTLAGTDEETLNAIAAYEKYSSSAICNYLGIHLEGPYFCAEQRGAQDERYLAVPTTAHYTKLLKSKSIKRLSAAPELSGGMELGRYCRKHNIIASVAHTNADFSVVCEAEQNGYSMLTHLYSGMVGVHRKNAFRYGGAVEAGLLEDGLTTEIIADGCHLPPCLLKLIYKCKGRERITLTSDAMRGAGLAEGSETVLGSIEKGQKVIIENGVAMMLDRTAFAGSVASGDRLINTMVKQANVPLADAVYMMTAVPARLLGLANKGAILQGMDADLIVFNENIDIKQTMVMGNMVYKA